MKPRICPDKARMRLVWTPLMLCAVIMPPARAQSTNAPAAPAFVSPAAEERARLREELQRLTPEERRERIRALRQQRVAPAPSQPASEERRRELLQRKIQELRRKKEAGNISPPEQALLERLERAVARREAARATNSPPQSGIAPAPKTNAPPQDAALPSTSTGASSP